MSPARQSEIGEYTLACLQTLSMGVEFIVELGQKHTLVALLQNKMLHYCLLILEVIKEGEYCPHIVGFHGVVLIPRSSKIFFILMVL